MSNKLKAQNEDQNALTLEEMLDASDSYWTKYFDDNILPHDLDINLLAEEDRVHIARILELLAASSMTMKQFLRNNLDTFQEHVANGTQLIEMAGE
ncbi:MAG: hypothetical protein WC248_07830 [Candidatus Methanomethylophilaceae archaeon]|jgi:hypothetical protein